MLCQLSYGGLHLQQTNASRNSLKVQWTLKSLFHIIHLNFVIEVAARVIVMPRVSDVVSGAANREIVVLLKKTNSVGVTGVRRCLTVVTPLVLASVLLAVPGMQQAQADVPSAGDDTAVITVKVGGARTDTSVTPVAGVQLALYSLGSDTARTGSMRLTDSWAVCTSDAAGDCSFVIPDTEEGGANYDRQFYVEQVGAPTGWFDDPTVVTSGDGTTFASTAYAVITGAQLRAGNTYSSTTDFMSTGSGVAASSGTWPESMNNPPMPSKCGLNIALIMDLSYSVQEAEALDYLKQAAIGLTQSLVGTSSKVALFTFGSNAPAQGDNNGNRPLTSVANQAGADQVISWINAMTITEHEATNWDQGLYQVATALATGSQFDVAIIITDGNPTRYGANPYANSSNGIATRYIELEQAIFSANAIKAKGTRVVAVGVGDSGFQAPYNLAAISGPKANSDYYAIGWSDAASALQQLALSGCYSSLVLAKMVNDSPDFQIDHASPLDWTLTSTDAAGHATNRQLLDLKPCTTAPKGDPCYDNTQYAVADPIQVLPGATYTLSESNPNPSGGAYVQSVFGMARSSLAPGATGSWQCYKVDPVTGAYDTLITLAYGGQITIPYNVGTLECVAVNSTAEFSATKIVKGGTATADSWTYSLTPLAPVASGAPVVNLGNWGTPYRVRPEQQYQVTENTGLPGYTLSDLTCTWTSPVVNGTGTLVHKDESILKNPVITLAANTTASCVFTNSKGSVVTTGGSVQGSNTAGLAIALLIMAAGVVLISRRWMIQH